MRPPEGRTALVVGQRGGDGAHEPGVDGHPFAAGRLFDALLERSGSRRLMRAVAASSISGTSASAGSADPARA